jgi:hypothetical protein
VLHASRLGGIGKILGLSHFLIGPDESLHAIDAVGAGHRGIERSAVREIADDQFGSRIGLGLRRRLLCVADECPNAPPVGQDVARCGAPLMAGSTRDENDPIAAIHDVPPEM